MYGGTQYIPLVQLHVWGYTIHTIGTAACMGIHNTSEYFFVNRMLSIVIQIHSHLLNNCMSDMNCHAYTIAVHAHYVEHFYNALIF